jgi:hypothetical protein
MNLQKLNKIINSTLEINKIDSMLLGNNNNGRYKYKDKNAVVLLCNHVKP